MQLLLSKLTQARKHIKIILHERFSRTDYIEFRFALQG